MSHPNQGSTVSLGLQPLFYNRTRSGKTHLRNLPNGLGKMTKYDMQNLTRLLLQKMCPTAPCSRYVQCFNETSNGEYCAVCIKSIHDNAATFADAQHVAYAYLTDIRGHTPQSAYEVIQRVIKNPKLYITSPATRQLSRLLMPKYG